VPFSLNFLEKFEFSGEIGEKSIDNIKKQDYNKPFLSIGNKNLPRANQRRVSMKKLTIVMVAILAICLSVAGCASIPASNLFGPGNYYSDTVKTGSIRGEATSRVWVGLFGKERYPPVERVAKDNGINKLSTVEHYAKPGILGIWTDYTTIVTGE
jgi:hypothetical protein